MTPISNLNWRRCYAARDHRWSKPMDSRLFGCAVQVCSVCGHVRKANL